jgi:hypothetical protein
MSHLVSFAAFSAATCFDIYLFAKAWQEAHSDNVELASFSFLSAASC